MNPSVLPPALSKFRKKLEMLLMFLFVLSIKTEEASEHFPVGFQLGPGLWGNGSGVFWNGEKIEGTEEEYEGGESSPAFLRSDIPGGDVINIHYNIHEHVFSDYPCIAEGQKCTFESRVRCCKGYCPVTDTVCTKCVKQYQPCTAGAKCCTSSFVCDGVSCKPKPRGEKCLPENRLCSDATPLGRCCTPLVCNKQHLCQKCVKTNGPCVTKKDCCDGIDECVEGFCKKTCAGHTSIKDQCSYKFKCCSYRDYCAINCQGSPEICRKRKGICVACRKNGETCSDASQCCWPGSECILMSDSRTRRCVGCLEPSQPQFPPETYGCKKNSDCCNKGGICGDGKTGLKGFCQYPRAKCNHRGDGCFFSRKCCPDLECKPRELEDPANGVTFTCQTP